MQRNHICVDSFNGRLVTLQTAQIRLQFKDDAKETKVELDFIQIVKKNAPKNLPFKKNLYQVFFC